MKPGEPPSPRWSAGPRLVRGLPRPDLDESLTPNLVPALVVGASVLAVLVGVAAVAGAFVGGLWLGLLALAVVPFLVLGVVALARVGGELALAVLRTAEDVEGIAARLPQLESTVHDVANEIPRFGFLKLLAGGRERSG